MVTVLKVEAVEVSTLHQVSQRFRLKGREAGVTDLPEMVKLMRELTELRGKFKSEVKIKGLLTCRPQSLRC